MRSWEFWILGGVVVGLVFCALALWQLRRDFTDVGRRTRLRVCGVALMGLIFPIKFFLEPVLANLIYLVVLFAVGVLGLFLYFRGGGWKDFP